MLTDMDPGTVADWEQGLRELAAFPNLSAKLSGLGTFEHRNDPELIAFIVERSATILGSGRLMFGSNFPIEKLWTDAAALVKAYRDAAARLPEADRADIFRNTAARVYRPV